MIVNSTSYGASISGRAAQLLVCNRDGQLGDARTDLLPHQISVAHRVVSSSRSEGQLPERRRALKQTSEALEKERRAI